MNDDNGLYRDYTTCNDNQRDAFLEKTRLAQEREFRFYKLWKEHVQPIACWKEAPFSADRDNPKTFHIDGLWKAAFKDLEHMTFLASTYYLDGIDRIGNIKELWTTSLPKIPKTIDYKQCHRPVTPKEVAESRRRSLYCPEFRELTAIAHYPWKNTVDDHNKTLEHQNSLPAICQSALSSSSSPSCSLLDGIWQRVANVQNKFFMCLRSLMTQIALCQAVRPEPITFISYPVCSLEWIPNPTTDMYNKGPLKTEDLWIEIRFTVTIGFA